MNAVDFIALARGEGIAFGSVCYLAKKIFAKYVGLQRLPVCLTIFGHNFQAIALKYFVYVGVWPRTAMQKFGEDPDPDIEICKAILHY